MKSNLKYVASALLVLLCGCVFTTPSPEISFIGISEGNLETSPDDFVFKDKFEPDQHEIVGVVGFSTVAEGTRVQATWFSPDDRKMPMGRKTITVASGATIARFSIASTQDWQPSPYMLDIRAMFGEADEVRTASGQVHFFIGMEDEDVTKYWEEWSAWKE